jgi:phospholipid N-methyltransferase
MGIATFAGEVFSDFQSTAAIVPSSRFLAEAMVEPLPLASAKVVVELGPGTGAMTGELLQRTPPDARILAFEINPRFVSYLRQEFPDPRFEVIEAGAESLSDELAARGIKHVDAALSSLGLCLLPEDVVSAILEELAARLADGGVLTQFQYVTRMRVDNGRPSYYDVGELLEQYFPSVKRRTIVRNLPPAFVYDCSRRNRFRLIA